MRPLSIAIVSKADDTGGGASRVAAELARLLIADGHRVHHWRAFGRPEPHARDLYGSFALPIRAVRKLARLSGWPDWPPVEYPLLARRLADYDVVHFHDLTTALSPLTPSLVARRKPVAWTFHDCSPFTGGCLYPLDCPKFKSRCGPCPQLGAWPLDTRFDFTGPIHALKRRLFAENTIRAVVPSRWSREMAVASGMFARPPEVIPNGIDTDVFRPFDRQALRRELGLPDDRRIVLIAAYDLSYPNKGAAFALEALRRLDEPAPFLLAVGGLGRWTEAAFSPLAFRHVGFLADDREKARWFAAADVALNASLTDTFSLVTAEAMACGTPTVGFATGGIPELVEHGVSGWMVPTGDAAALSHGLARALAGDAPKHWGEAARARIVERFSHPGFLAAHLSLYREMMGR